MEEDDSGRPADSRIRPVEEALTVHLARAHLLGERAQLANGLAQHEIDEARHIAERLTGQLREHERHAHLATTPDEP